MPNTTTAKTMGSRELAEQQLASVRAAVERLSGMLAAGLSEAERAQIAGLEQAAGRLVEIAEAIDAEGLTVAGSMGQRRPHPLLAEERALRKEIGEQLSKLDFRIGERARLERLRVLTRQVADAAPPNRKRNPRPKTSDATTTVRSEVVPAAAPKSRHSDRAGGRKKPDGSAPG